MSQILCSSTSYFTCATRVIGLIVFLSSPVFAQRDLKDIPPPDPELERETFILPEGFEVNLFAADPQIAKPIQMNFDPQGRLWIVSSSVYPHIEPGAQADDKVLVLQDLDGDGISDETRVFAEGLLIPTAVAPGDGGVYVGASTELLHFKDLDGDGKADERRVVLSGFGTEDTHHILHTFRWGPECLLYMSQSIYIHSHIETPWGVKRLNAGGIWQYRPETMELNVFARGLVNTWGTAFDYYGQTFATDGAGGEGINYMVPGAYYTTAYGAPRILQGLNPGSPKHCGLEIAESEHLPEDWKGSFLTNDFRGHRVCRFVLAEDGAGYRSQEQQEVIKSNHVAFRPIDVKVGPDGAIYIADWYNPIIQHGEVDFRDPRRDHTHGRIWRVTHRGSPLVERQDFTKQSNEQLLANLQSPNKFTRLQSKRVLKERGPDVLTDLQHWTATLSDATLHAKLEALWMFQALDVVNASLLEELLNASEHPCRAAATRIIGHWKSRLDDPLGLLQARVNDEHPQVRLEAVRVLAEMPSASAVQLALEALNHPVDHWLDYGLWLAVRELQPVWEPALAAGEIDFSQRLPHLTFLLQATGTSAAMPQLLAALDSPALSAENVQQILSAIGTHGQPQHLAEIYQRAVDSGRNAQLRQQLLNALLVAARRKVQPPNLTGAETLLSTDDAQVLAAAIRCLGAWKHQATREQIVALTLKTETPVNVRQAGINALSQFADDAAAQHLIALITGETPTNLKQTAIVELLEFRPGQAAKQAAAYLSELTSADGSLPIFNAFLSRKGGPDLLAQALEGQELAKDVAVLGTRVLNSSGQGASQLNAVLRQAGKLVDAAIKLTPEEMQQLVGEVQTSGHAARGEEIFRRYDLGCLKCHAIGPAGGEVGSNILSLGATAQLDYIIESLLDPNAKVKEGYHTVVVATDTGKVFSGIKVRESDTDLFLRDAEGRMLQVPRDSIDDQQQGASLMPVGLMSNLTHQELIDLAAFLGALGKEPEYTISTTPVIRLWEELQATPEAAFRLRRTSYATAATDDAAFTWTRVYSHVNGTLDVQKLPQVMVKNRSAPGTRGIGFVRTEFRTDAAGKVTLSLNDPTGLQIWIDEQPIDAATTLEAELPAGTHRLTIAVDQSQRSTGLLVAPVSDNVVLPAGK